MPAIIQDEKQTKALKDIEQNLAIVEGVNVALSGEMAFSVMATPQNGKAVKIDICEKDTEKIIKVLAGYKKRLAKDIEVNAAQYRISLNEHEREVLK